MSPETMQLVKFIAEWSGSLGLFIGYAIVSLGWRSPKAKIAIVLNLIGSGGFVALNYLYQSWPAVAVNVIWFVIGIFTLIWVRRPDLRNCSRILSKPSAACCDCQDSVNADHRNCCQSISQ